MKEFAVTYGGKNVKKLTGYCKKGSVFHLFLSLIFFSLLFLPAYAQTVPPLPGQDQPFGEQQPCADQTEWTTSDSNGFNYTFVVVGGQLNVNSKISSINPQSEGINVDDALTQSIAAGMSLIGLNDNSAFMTARSFFLSRGEMVKQAKEYAIPLPGFRFEGDATITVLGADNFVYYNPSGGIRSVAEDFLTSDFITTHTSEMDYVNRINEGTLKFSSSGTYTQITSELTQYVNYWVNEQGYDFNVLYAPGTESQKALRKDMEKRLTEKDKSMYLSEGKVNFDDLRIWIRSKGSMSDTFFAMFCTPEEGQTDYMLPTFFKDKYDQSSTEYFALAEVSGSGAALDQSLYRNALTAGWKVAPGTSLNNTGEITRPDADLFTGIWMEKRGVLGSESAREDIIRALEAFRKRRVFVSSLRRGGIRLYAVDKFGQTAALMGEDLDGGRQVSVQVNVSYNKSVEKLYMMTPRLVVVYRDDTIREFPFNALYRDVNGRKDRVDRIYHRNINSLTNARAIFAVTEAFDLNTGEFDEKWTYYKMRKYFEQGLIQSTPYQIISAPIYIN